MKLSKKILALMGGVALLTSTVVFTGCSEDEDENNMLDDYSISLTNDGTLTANGKDVTATNPAIAYARSWNVTKTKHVSADATIKIDRKTKSTQVGQTKNATNGSVTTTDGGNNAAYMFGLTGSGTEKEPYSFYLVGFRLYGTTPQYFISYYTGVQSSYCNSDANDFDVDSATNAAYEYVAVSAWSSMPSGSYTLTEDALTVYIDLDAIYGDSNTVVTKDNYSSAKTAGINGYKVTLKPNATATGVSKTLHYSDFKAQSYSNKTAPALTAFSIDQTYLGFYAMVSKNKTLVANLAFNNDTIVKSVIGSSTDDFGKAIDLEGESLKNF